MRLLATVHLAVGLVLAGVTTRAEQLTFEAFAVAPSGERERLAGGVQTYDPAKDIVIRESDGGGSTHWTKWIVLEGDFAISVSVYREPELTGFGMTVARPDDGFSWEWFDLESGDVFLKRQGSARVKVTVLNGEGFQELQAVEFLDDVVLRYLDDMSKPPGTHTHELLVRKGSVVRVAPDDGRLPSR
jgi:hypothetical protein